MGIVATLLTACGLGARSDVDAVRDAVQAAVSALSEHLEGQIRFQDSVNAGTTLSGVLVLTGADRDQVEASLLTVLETAVRTYLEQPRVRTAHVRIEAHPEGDRSTRVQTADVVPPSSGANVTTDDLAAHFGL